MNHPKINKKRKPNSSWEPVEGDMEFEETSMLNSTKLERAETTSLIEKYKDKSNVDNDDLKELIVAVLEGQLRSGDQISSIKDNLTKTKYVVQQHDVELGNLRSEINVLKQKQFDTEVILAGFPDLPNEPAVLAAIHKKFPFTRNEITRLDSWVTSKNNIKRGFMTMTFCSKNAQIKFMQEKIKNGPIFLSELTQEQNQQQDKMIIYFSNRLSRNNQAIHKEIRDHIKDKRIHKSRFRNCQFEIQINTTSDFVPISSLVQLSNLME